MTSNSCMSLKGGPNRCTMQEFFSNSFMVSLMRKGLGICQYWLEPKRSY